MDPENKGRKRKVLVVDSSSSVRSSVWMILKDEYVVLTASELAEALEVVRGQEVEVVLVGVDLPVAVYEPFLRSLRQVVPQVALLLLLGEGAGWEREYEWPLSDWLSKPFGVPVLVEKVRGLLAQRDWVEKRRVLGFGISGEERVKRWFYSLRVSGGVRERVLRVAGSSLPVFIQGEEGTGRSGVARAVHWLGGWRGRPFLRVCCRGLTLEGFRERVLLWLGAEGRGGLTLYLEEVDRLGWEMQGVLLDFLEEGRVGWPGMEGLGVEVRVISSGRGSLWRAVSGGRLRGDLGEFLGVLGVELRPLRERREEIPGIVGEVLREHRREGLEGKRFSAEAMGVLQDYWWPGNLRELEGVVLRSAALKVGEMVLPEDLVFSFSEGENRISKREKKKEEGIPNREPFWDAVLPILAHEIKNPLVAISTFAYLLPEKYEDAEFREQFSRLVGLDVKRINELLENLLEYSQFSEPRLIGNDLNARLVEILRLKEKDLAQRGVQLIMDLPEGLPAVLFDEGQLGFVLRNVLHHALGRVNDKKSLRLATAAGKEKEGDVGPGFVELNLWYDGQSGMLRSLQGEHGEGKGAEIKNWSLMLVLARRVMIRNGGEMQVSLGEEAGTTVRLRFPAARSA